MQNAAPIQLGSSFEPPEPIKKGTETNPFFCCPFQCGVKETRTKHEMRTHIREHTGEVIEPVPLNAEDLLRTSFKFADNTVMTGGKESRVYGIEVKTGKIRYECTMAGCFSPTGEHVEIENYL